MNRALFLDRDGVINEDYGYVHKIEDFHFRDGIFDVCRAAQKARMKIIVATNQAGIGRGFYTVKHFEEVTSFMLSRFTDANIFVAGVYHCPFHPEYGIGHFNKQSYNRKPNPGMLLSASRDHNINPFLSIMIGDKDSDKGAADRIGVRHYIDATLGTWLETSLRHIAE